MKRTILKGTLLALAIAAVAGCGGSKHGQTTIPATPPDPAVAMKALIRANPALGGTVRTLYQTPTWAVVESAGKQKAAAFAFHLVGGKWVADRSGKVKLDIVGPEAGATAGATPHVEVRFTTPSASIESALWIDGSELVERGGGTPTQGTISGTPLHALQPGLHVAVGYARSRSHGAAVAWVFSVG